MRSLRKLMAFGAGAVLLLVSGIVVWIWVTMPPTPHPDSLPSQALAPPPADYAVAIEEGRGIARAIVAEEKLPGLSLAVAIDGELIWAEGINWADLESKVPVTPATRFRIGGISTAITAAAAGLLSERGLLDFDAPVQEYLPEFPEKQWPVSTRQLMAHMAGFRDFGGEGGSFPGTDCADDFVRLSVFADDRLGFRPGTRVAYSTYGWVLVGAVIAAVADRPYHDFVRSEILEPLGMQSTAPELSGEPASDVARFYYPRFVLNPRYGLQDAPATELLCVLPAAGFLSTPSDLVRFGSAMMGDLLLEPAMLEELQTPVPLRSGDVTSRALGWSVRDLPVGAEGMPVRVVAQGLGPSVLRRPLSVVTTSGHVPGETAALVLVPGYGIAIAIVTNVSGSNRVSLLAERLIGIFVGVGRATAGS